MNDVKNRLLNLRSAMKDENVSWCFFTSDDYHASEYVADYFKIREYFTGFTGENAFLLINADTALMWTDARFFLQAEIELKDTGITLMKMGEKGVPSISEYIKDNVKEGEIFSFDGRCVSTGLGKKIEGILSENKATLIFNKDIAGSLWKERPTLPVSKLFILDNEYTGEDCIDKINRIKEALDKEKADSTFLGSIDDIAWITNVRGMDVKCNPVFLSYMIISKSETVIFMEKEEASDEIKAYFESKNIKIKDYNQVLEIIKDYDFGNSVLLDEESVNFACFNLISKNRNVIKAINPSTKFKAVKNKTEIKCLKDAYLRDSVCVTKFIYWLKNAIKTEALSEIKASDYLDALRKDEPDFIDLSFPTISGYAENGAIVHYTATKESDKKLRPEGFLLVDSGGQYKKGTTDVTRTISLGRLTDKMKLYYTKVAVGMLKLADAKFLYGCTGRNLDVLARMSLWEMGIDYKHGTGHGVGHVLNVHEGPQSFRWKYTETAKEALLEPGMTTSDEPGVYIDKEFGVRIENVILCIEKEENEYGRFLGFEHLTYVPFDRAAIDVSALSDAEIKLINKYNASVYAKTKDFLTIDEALWLKNETNPL